MLPLDPDQSDLPLQDAIDRESSGGIRTEGIEGSLQITANWLDGKTTSKKLNLVYSGLFDL